MSLRLGRGALLAVLTTVAATVVADAQGPTRDVVVAPERDVIVPFKIQVSDAVLSDLKDRLARTRFPAEIPGAGWDYGTDLTYLKELVAYWRTRFDWRAAERRLNQFAQFTTNIDGLDVHFIHQRSSNPNAMALAVTHGWPGSITEFT